MILPLPDEAATEGLGAGLYKILSPGSVVYLHGPLGAGKTTLVRGFLRAAGFQGKVKSPTYTIVETYAIQGLEIAHFDLYRLQDPEALEWLGFRDYLQQAAVVFIEWPELGKGFLPLPDWVVRIEVLAEIRRAILETKGIAEEGQRGPGTPPALD